MCQIKSTESWWRLTVSSEKPITPADREIIEAPMLDFGFIGLSEEQNEQEAAIHFYFDAATDTEELKHTIEERLLSLESENKSLKINIIMVKKQNWAEEWKSCFKPINVGRRIVVLPPWEKNNEPDRIPLIIDPGEAFGTGTHETTRLCLELMEDKVKPGMSVLDVGSGSGILSIAACLLGADEVVGIEKESAAVENAEKNLTLNNIPEEKVTFINDDALSSFEGKKFDLILCNMVITNFSPLLKDIYTMLKPAKSHLVLSGYLLSERNELTAILPEKLIKTEEKEMGEWGGAVFTRKSRFSVTTVYKCNLR